jgi:hypothetical protein
MRVMGLQAGWASDDAPACYFPTLVGQVADMDGPPLLAERLRAAMGAPLQLRRPVRDSVVACFDDYQALLCDTRPQPPSHTHALALSHTHFALSLTGEWALCGPESTHWRR